MGNNRGQNKWSDISRRSEALKVPDRTGTPGYFCKVAHFQGRPFQGPPILKKVFRYLEEMIQENKILENESQPTPSQPIEPTTISATSKLTFNHSIFMLSFIFQDFSCDGKKLKFYCVCDRGIIYFGIYFDRQNIDHVSKCKLKWIETWILVHFNVIDRLWSKIIPQS